MVSLLLTRQQLAQALASPGLLTTKCQLPASNKVWKKQRRRPAKQGVIASVTHPKGSNYNEIAVLYYVAGEAVCPVVLDKIQTLDERCLPLITTGMGACHKE